MMDDVDFVLSAEDRSELVKCVTLLQEVESEQAAEVVARLESVLANLVEL
jgi:hypothetical protein